MAELEFVGGPWPPDQPHQKKITLWDAYENHREIVTQIICGDVEGSSSACIFGAGQCFDIDLPTLLDRFESLTLADIETEIVEQGVDYQKCADHENLNLLTGVDLLGIKNHLLDYAEKQDDDLIQNAIKALTAFQPKKLATYDCVASTCLLSQLLNEVSETVPQNHNCFVDLLKAVRQRHIEIMLQALNPGGHGVLVTDIVSSESLPDLAKTADLETTIGLAIQNQNYLHGLNPKNIAAVFHEPQIEKQISKIRVSKPWRWVLPSRIYACFAIEFFRLPERV